MNRNLALCAPLLLGIGACTPYANGRVNTTLRSRSLVAKSVVTTDCVADAAACLTPVTGAVRS
jgi:hypothetical protein